MSNLRWKRLDLKATVPERKTLGSAGYDLSSIIDFVVRPGETVRVSTGLAVAIPYGFVGLIKPRSSAFFKGLDLDGTVDADYRGELMLQVHNRSGQNHLIMAGERIAQMVVASYYQDTSKEVDSLDDTERGTGGFGSTGK